MPRPVLTKKDFVKRYSGVSEFGNAAPTWDTFDDWLFMDGNNFPIDQLYHIRNRIKGGKTWYDIPCLTMTSMWKRASAEVGQENLYISAMCPHHRGTIQGEVQQGLWGLDLTWTTGKLPMRTALAKYTFSLSGLIVRSTLRRYMNDLSYQWLQWLLEAYPNHVVEFTCLNTCWGTVPGHNTIFWEVRSY